MPIAIIDKQTNKLSAPIYHEGWKNEKTKYTAAEVATGLGLAPGTWREITDAEAAELMQPTLEEAHAAKLAEVMTSYSAAFSPIESVYPKEERETWPSQLEEAISVLGGSTAETPMLSGLIAQRGLDESLQEFAQKVMVNNLIYRKLAGDITGQQQRMYREVNELKTVEEVQAYKVAYVMPEGLGYGG
ncbi:conserved hypothetical protein [uncultured delta proteobacterium]|uniref:Uncharacterized protein n=1 Tax=uncultured delta proteobacterium TaxID=34034 RepID=A0A212IXX9_9DELT|nr:conserved hypothetical protein [uncultured delta proteobacterium]